MLTEKDYCDYETQKSLMELGFPIVAQSYDLGNGLKEYLPKIHLYDAQKWLREEKGIFVYIDVPWKTDDGLGWSYICCNKPLTEEDQEVCFASGGFFDSYEEALSEGIKEAVKLLQEKK